MLKKMFLGVLFAVWVLDILIGGTNIVNNDNVMKAEAYSSSGTYVGGIIWENTTWTLENSPYYNGYCADTRKCNAHYRARCNSHVSSEHDVFTTWKNLCSWHD